MDLSPPFPSLCDSFSLTLPRALSLSCPTMIVGKLWQAISPSRSFSLVSHSCSLSLSLFLLSHSISLSKSLFLLEYEISRSSNSSELAATCAGRTDSDSSKMAYSSSVAAQMPTFGSWGRRPHSDDRSTTSGHFDDDQGLVCNYHTLFITMIPFIHDENFRIIGTLFRAK